MSLRTSIINQYAPPASAFMALVASAGAAAAAPQVSVKPVANTSGLYIYRPGMPVKFNVHADVSTTQSKPFLVRWMAGNFGGHRVSGGTFTLGSGGSGAFTLSAKTAGMVYIHTRLVDPGNNDVAVADTRIAFMTTTPRAALNANPVLFGVCAHFHNSSKRDCDRELSLISALGFQACRFDCVIDLVHPTPAVTSWEMYDHIFGRLSGSGVQPCPLIVDWSHNPGIIERYAPFAAEAAHRYGNVTRYWEVWNEPDLDSWKGTAQEYAAFFDQASAAIHKEEPNAAVMNGGVSEVKMRPNFVPDFLRAVKTQPGIFAYHSHGEFGNMTRAAGEIQRHMRADNRHIPLWLNEAGYSNWGKLTERDQAIVLTKKMSYIPALGTAAYFWYELRDDGVNKPDPESNYGLVDRDFLPKASSVAAHTLIGTLQGQKFLRRISIAGSPQVYALLFGRPDSRKGTIVLWNDAGGAVPCMWRVPGSATQRTMMGADTKLSAVGGVISTAASPEPQFIVFNGAASVVSPLGSPIAIASPIYADSDTAVRVPFSLQFAIVQSTVELKLPATPCEVR